MDKKFQKNNNGLRADLVPPEEASGYLNIKENTLATWRCTKEKLLPYVKLGKRVYYLREDLDNFITENRKGGLDRE